MKTEVLNRIKELEQEYTTTVSMAIAEKKKSIANAELEADNLVLKASSTAEDYKKKRISDARNDAGKKHDEILQEGRRRATAMKDRGSGNLPRAVDLLVRRFKEQLHVQA